MLPNQKSGPFSALRAIPLVIKQSDDMPGYGMFDSGDGLGSKRCCAPSEN